MKMHIATPTQNKQKYKIIAHTHSVTVILPSRTSLLVLEQQSHQSYQILGLHLGLSQTYLQLCDCRLKHPVPGCQSRNTSYLAKSQSSTHS